MREFIGTNVQTPTTGTINVGVSTLTDYTNAGNTHAEGEIVIIGNVAGVPVVFKADGTDAVAKAKRGLQFGVKTPSTIKWSGIIPNNPTTVVTKCLSVAAVASVKVYTIAASGTFIAGMYVGITVENMNYPYYMGSKRMKLFEYQLTTADITSYAINSTGWTAITTKFNATFNTKLNWCTMSSGSGANFTLTANIAGVDIKASGSLHTSVITMSTNTSSVFAAQTGTKTKADETSIATRSGYNPFWEIDANMWTAQSMIDTTLNYTTYVIEYTIPNPGAIVIPALQRRECIIAVPKYSTGTTTNPDVTALDAIFTALANNGVVTSNAVTGSAPSTVGAAATTTVESTGGLIFRTA